jgi:hypothetical protein
MATRPTASASRQPPQQQRRPHTITRPIHRGEPQQQHDPQALPCPCCATRAPTRHVVKHGDQCVECAWVIWSRDVEQVDE